MPKKKISFSSSLIEELLFRSWWLVVFFLLCHIAYLQACKRLDQKHQRLLSQLESLKIEKKEALAKQEDFQRQIQSQSDHRWIELTLMKGLGLVPEGQQKVFFDLKPESKEETAL